MKNIPIHSNYQSNFRYKDCLDPEEDAFTFHFGLKRHYPISQVLIDLFAKRRKKGR